MKRFQAFLLLFAASFTTCAQAPNSPSTLGWIGSWAASQQVPEPNNAVPPASLDKATLRQIVHFSVGGSMIRVRVSNAFGTAPLRLLAVHVARPLSPSSSRIDPASDRRYFQ